jgi:integrative and conjugative element protein (TIGR02256 family)
MISYLAAGGTQTVTFSDAVLEHFSLHRQLRPNDTEAGGQLFARLSGAEIEIVRATGPRVSDRRTRFSFWPHRWSERREIQTAYHEGLHYVGDWHTHPEGAPKPSSQDLKSIADVFRQSKHDLTGILMVIVGIQTPPSGLYVAIADAMSVTPLVPLAPSET